MSLNVETTPPLILIGPWVLLNIFGFKGPTAATFGVGGLYTKSYLLHGRNHTLVDSDWSIYFAQYLWL